MNLLGNRLPRAAYAAAAGFLFLALISVIIPGIVLAANPNQLPNRFIKMSDSAQSNGSITTGVGSGTNVNYTVGFDNPQAFQSVIVDFCQNDPLIGDTCDTADLTGFDASTATLDAADGTLNTGAGWSIAAQSAAQVRLVGTSSVAIGTGQSFELHGITNPDYTGTFYARIYTYAGNNYTDGAGGAAYNDTSNGSDAGSYDGYGGIALSTVKLIQITARVMEQITFCVSGDDPVNAPGVDPLQDNTCAAALTPSLTLGQGTPQVLDASRVDTAQAWTQLSTNALSGAIVRMRNTNSCGGLSADFGTTCSIPAVDDIAGQPNVSPLPNAITAGTAAFGLWVSDSTPNATGGSGTVDPSCNYHDCATPAPNDHNSAANGFWYGMHSGTVDDPNSDGVATRYGDPICSSAGPVSGVNNTLQFAATISNTTPAGIYTANMDLIATGTF